MQGLTIGIFLSTLPVRGATGQGVDSDHPVVISIHAPREGSDGGKVWRSTIDNNISIHAPREGSDPAPHGSRHQCGISIHAPREGSDPAPEPEPGTEPISIHAPREGSDGQLQQVLPVEYGISIHAPREGSDL